MQCKTLAQLTRCKSADERKGVNEQRAPDEQKGVNEQEAGIPHTGLLSYDPYHVLIQPHVKQSRDTIIKGCLMAYQCMDCSHKSAVGFSGGHCPGCGSFNIRTARKSMIYEPEKPRKTLLELALMGLLWGLIIYGVWDKYLQ